MAYRSRRRRHRRGGGTREGATSAAPGEGEGRLGNNEGQTANERKGNMAATVKLLEIERLLSQLQIACGLGTTKAGSCVLFDVLLEAVHRVSETAWEEFEPDLIPVIARHIGDAVMAETTINAKSAPVF